MAFFTVFCRRVVGGGIFTILLLWACGGPAARAQSDDEAVRAVVAKANLAYQQRDFASLQTVLDPTNFNFPAYEQLLQGGIFSVSAFKITSATIRRVAVTGGQALVRVTWERADPKTGKAVVSYGQNQIDFKLVKRGEDWKVHSWTNAENGFADALYAAPTVEERRRILAAEPELDPRQSLIRLSFRHRDAGRYEQSGEVLEIAGWLAEERHDEKLLPIITVNYGLLAKAQGRYPEALNYYLAALRQSEQIKGIDGQMLALANIGGLYWQQGNAALALDYAQRSLDIAAKQDEAKVRVPLETNYILSGNIYAARGETDRALEYYQKAAELGVKYGNYPADALPPIGLLYAQQGKLPEAVHVLQKALELRKRAPDTKDYCSIETRLAELYLQQDDTAAALPLARHAIALAQKLMDAELLQAALTVEGRCLMALQQPDAAQQSFIQAIDAIEKQRRQVVGTEQAFRQYLETRQAPYQAMVALSVATGDTDAALAYAERGKGRVLSDILRGRRVESGPLLTASERGEESTRKNRLATLNRQITLESLKLFPDKTLTADLEKQRDAARLSYEDFQTQMTAVHPQLRLAAGVNKLITKEERAELLARPNDALLEYAVTDKQVFLFVLTRAARADGPPQADLRVYPLSLKPAALVAAVQDFQRSVAQRQVDYFPLAQDLYRHLLAPAHAQLAGKDNFIIIPDRELWAVPFAALHDGARFLAQTVAVSYAPSLSARREMRQAAARQAQVKNSSGLLALGNPALGATALARVTTQARDETLQPLPEAEQEVKTLGRLYAPHSRVHIGADAREDLWKQEAGRYRRLQLAAHGAVNLDNPLYSRIFLAPGGAAPQPQDGLLEAWEVMQLDLKAEIVVLSACETGGGRISAGEGLIGLSWAFFVAGVPTTVASQWRVDSPATTDFMLEFHRQLSASGKSPRPSQAEALRRAAVKLMQRADTNHPYYWAAFTLVGGDR